MLCRAWEGKGGGMSLVCGVCLHEQAYSSRKSKVIVYLYMGYVDILPYTYMHSVLQK